MIQRNAIRILFNHPYNENYQELVINALQENIIEFCSLADIFQVELNMTVPENINPRKGKFMFPNDNGTRPSGGSDSDSGNSGSRSGQGSNQ
jgi:hypothetical protein